MKLEYKKNSFVLHGVRNSRISKIFTGNIRYDANLKQVIPYGISSFLNFPNTDIAFWKESFTNADNVDSLKLHIINEHCRICTQSKTLPVK